MLVSLEVAMLSFGCDFRFSLSTEFEFVVCLSLGFDLRSLSFPRSVVPCLLERLGLSFRDLAEIQNVPRELNYRIVVDKRETTFKLRKTGTLCIPLN